MNAAEILRQRDEIDRSLQTERENNDQALTDKLAIVDDAADDVIEQARIDAKSIAASICCTTTRFYAPLATDAPLGFG